MLKLFSLKRRRQKNRKNRAFSRNALAIFEVLNLTLVSSCHRSFRQRYLHKQSPFFKFDMIYIYSYIVSGKIETSFFTLTNKFESVLHIKCRAVFLMF